MRPSLLVGLVAVLLVGCVSSKKDTSTSLPELNLEYLGMVTLPGTTTDLSGLTDPLPDGTPHHQLGGLSAIDYTGKNNLYLQVADRGPKDGAVPYACRFHLTEVVVDPTRDPVVSIKLMATHLLKDAEGRQYNGANESLDPAHPERSLRFDPEGARVGPTGTLFISDEYGPYLREFDRTGKLLRSFVVPEKFLPNHPAPDPKQELPPKNTRGRIPNRGMEGLAITPDGKKLVGILQSPLIQDGGLGPDQKRIGLNVRILEVDIATGKTREFVYQLEDPSHGINEILAITDREYLVLERDSLAGTEAQCKKLFKIDLTGATEVSEVPSLPSTGPPATIRPVAKSLYADFLDPRYGLSGKDIPEKFEGITFGPNLPDGRRLLLLTADNDFLAEQPFRLYAFAVK